MREFFDVMDETKEQPLAVDFRPAAQPWATGMFARDEAEIRHQLARRVKSPPIDELRGQHHRAMHLESAKTLERTDGRRVRWRERELRDVLIERVTPRQFAFEQGEVLPHDEPILGGEWGGRTREVTQPDEMGRPPMEPRAIDEAASCEKLEDVVSRLHHFALQRLAASHDITNAILCFIWNANGRQLPGAIQPRQLAGIVFVVFPLYPRFDGDQRRGNDIAIEAPPLHRALQHVARATRFVARANLAVLRVAHEDAPQFREVIRILVDARRRGRGGGEHRDRDGVLVNVEAEIDD